MINHYYNYYYNYKSVKYIFIALDRPLVLVCKIFKNRIIIKKSFTWNGLSIWNSISHSVKSLNKSEFQNEIKKLLFDAIMWRWLLWSLLTDTTFCKSIVFIAFRMFVEFFTFLILIFISCMSARAEKTFQTHIGWVAVALPSLAVSSLKPSVTPIFFGIYNWQNMSQIWMLEVYYFLIFSSRARSNRSHFAAFCCFERLRIQLLKTGFTLRDFKWEIYLFKRPTQKSSGKGSWPASIHLKYFAARSRRGDIE